MITLLCILDIYNGDRTKVNSIHLSAFDILIFSLILICIFQNVPCALGFEVNYRKFSVEV